MYEKKFVRKRKRRIRTAIITGFCLTGVTALAIVAFLGRFVGTFTVNLNTGGVELTLSESKTFDEPTSFLMINNLPTFGEYTYSSIKKNEAFIDSEESHYMDPNCGAIVDDEGKLIGLNFFKYTFYVKNVGSITARYTFTINVLENILSDDNRTLLDTLRVALYENDEGTSQHDVTVYANAAKEANVDEDGNKTDKEYISTPKSREDGSHPCFGLAELFESDSKITTLSVSNFRQGDIKRYTLVMWLEGEDPSSSNDSNAPKGASIKLGVEINAYENQ